VDSKDLQLEQKDLGEMGQCLNAALFIVDRLIEELREEEGLLENDPQIGQLFSHLTNHLSKIDRMIKGRNSRVGDLIEQAHQKEKGSSHSSLR
jgi:hypothetical protein